MHIKCDEFVPKCRNCTDHGRQCCYPEGALRRRQNASSGSVQLDNADSLWACDESIVQEWIISGIAPFPELELPKPAAWSGFNKRDWQHVHHICIISTCLQLSSVPRASLWGYQMPLFLRIACSSEFVAKSILALSATRFAWMSKSIAADTMAAEYRRDATHGLREAIDNFSKDNADQILAASIILSLQTYEWRDWGIMMQGVSTTIAEMESWDTESPILASVEILHAQAEFDELFPPHTINHTIGVIENPRALLDQAIESLEVVSLCLDGREEPTKAVRALMDCVQHLQICNHTPSILEQFRILHPLRSWLALLPCSILDITKCEPAILVTLAHYYAVGLAAASMFPAIDHAFFINSRIVATIRIYQALIENHFYRCTSCGQVHDTRKMLKFPMTVVAASLRRRTQIGSKGCQ